MRIEKIREVIERARKGIAQYLEIMELFSNTDMSTDKDFQRKFNGFYRIRQRPPEWYEQYYSYMQSQKDKNPTFSNVLIHFYSILGRYEPSFSSKLVATIDVNSPVWDSVVLRYTGIKTPLYTSKSKVDQAEAIYKKLQEWHDRHMRSDHGKLILQTFEEMVPEHKRISDLKKIDFVLWQNRAEQDGPPDRR
jgi:flagellar assembly factor FliW